MTTPTTAERSQTVGTVLFLVAILVAWFVLQMWVLPKLGVST